jgi:ribosomal protein L39E
MPLVDFFSMGSEKNSGHKVKLMKATTSMGKKMVKANSAGMMELPMRENFGITSSKVKILCHL